MPWTDAQQLTVAFVPKFTSILSLFGSMWILIEVVTHKGTKRKITQPYNRLLLAMSVYDILESVWNFASSWPIPDDTIGVHNPVGNTFTCTAQGYFLTLSVAVPIYNAMLSLYYVLVIRYRFTETSLKRWIEPMMHIVAFVFAFGTATASAFMGLINNANLWCWIAPYPGDCLDSRRYPDEANCERGDNAWIYRWAFYFAPLWFCILFATGCTLLVYQYVYSLDDRTLQYRNPQRSLSSISEGSSMRLGEASSELGADPDSDEDTGPVDRRSMLSKWKTKRSVYAEDYQRSREVFHQSLWFLGTFYITHVWSTSNRIIQQLNNGQTYFALVAIHSFFDPLQGFLNCLVYQRPRYLRIRKRLPEIGRLRAAYHTFRFSCMPEIEAFPTSEKKSRWRSQSSGTSQNASPQKSTVSKFSRCSNLESIQEEVYGEFSTDAPEELASERFAAIIETKRNESSKTYDALSTSSTTDHDTDPSDEDSG